MPHRQTGAGTPEPGTLPVPCSSVLSSAAEVLATAMAGGGALGCEHRKHRSQAGVRHHPGRPRWALDVPCAALNAPLLHTQPPAAHTAPCVHTQPPAAHTGWCSARPRPHAVLRAVRVSARAPCRPLGAHWRRLVLTRSTPRGQAHLWRDLPSQAWAPVLALAWATQIASTSSTRWPRTRPASRRSRCALFIGRISLRAAVGCVSFCLCVAMCTPAGRLSC